MSKNVRNSPAVRNSPLSKIAHVPTENSNYYGKKYIRKVMQRLETIARRSLSLTIPKRGSLQYIAHSWSVYTEGMSKPVRNSPALP